MNGSFRLGKAAVVLTGAFLIVGVIAPIASAADSTATIATSTSDDIMWFEGNVDQVAGESVVMVIKAPRKNGHGNVLWTRCEFSFKGSGDYRCGLDVASGSIASERSGQWKANLVVDGVKVSTTRFKTS